MCWVVFIAALLPSAWSIWSVEGMPQFGFYHDDSVYFVSAKSIAEGRGYRIISLPEEPAQTKYPPLYPALLSLVWTVSPEFPANLQIAKPINLAVLLVFLILAERILRTFGASTAERWLACIVLGINPVVIMAARHLMADLLFTTLALAAVLLSLREGRRLALAAGAVAGLAYLAKTAAIAAIAGIALGYVLHRRWREVPAFLLAPAIAVAGWESWAFLHRAPAPDDVALYYTDYAGYHRAQVAAQELPGLVWANLTAMPAAAGGTVFGSFPWPGVLLAIAVAGLVAIRPGIARHPYTLSCAGLAALLAVWNYPPNGRFLLIAAPLLVIGFVVAMREVTGRARLLINATRLWRRVAGMVLSLLLAGSMATSAVAALIGLAAAGTYGFEQKRKEAEVVRAAELVRSRVPAGDAVLAFRDAVLYLRTGRHAVRLQVPSTRFYSRDRERALRPLRDAVGFCRRRGIGYMLVMAGDYAEDAYPHEYAAVLRGYENDPALELINSGPGVQLYRIRGGKWYLSK